MADKKIIEHRVILYLTKDCDDRTMSDRQVKRWVEDHFDGCEYGVVRVADVFTEEKKGKG